MSNDLALVGERLRDDLEGFRRALRKQYPTKSAQVHSTALRRAAAALAERGLVDLCGPTDFATVVGLDVSADLNVEFQRLLTASGKSAKRTTYESTLTKILDDFTGRVVIPLKQAGTTRTASPVTSSRQLDLPTSAFLGHSFDAVDSEIVECVKSTLQLLGITVITGERPRADRISEKVKRFIDGQPMFVGLYTRRDKIARKSDWTASPWVIEEKAYAVAKRKKLILLKEHGISNIGGIQGDYEYIDFTRRELHNLVFRILRLFELKATGFAD